MVLGLSTGLEKGFSPLSKRGSWAFRAGLGQLLTGTSKVPEVNQQEPEVKANRLGAREAAGDRAELGERDRRAVLVVETDGSRGERLRVVRREPRGRPKLPFGGDRPQRLLVAGAAQEMCLRRAARADEARHEGWETRSAGRMPEVLGPHGRRRVGLHLLRLPPGAPRVRLLSRKSERKTELETDEGAPRIAGGEDAQPARRPCRPGLQRLTHLLGDLGPGGWIRRKGRRLARLTVHVASRRERDADGGPRSGQGSEADDDPDLGARAHLAGDAS